jgi:Leucine-rich repeat (LRR) protein
MPSLERPFSASGLTVPTLPLRADVLLSNTLFEELDSEISEDFLRRHLAATGCVDNLAEADFLELRVDAASGSQRVERLGELLPKLRQLRLSQSWICSIRDLGTSLTGLRVLWIARCSLQDLGGISSLPILEELYLPFNDVHELSPLYAHDALQVIDLEGNLVDDFEEVKSLESLPVLRELTLTMNPVTQRENCSRESVLRVIPQLEMLDDIPVEDIGGLTATADDLAISSSDSDLDDCKLTGSADAGNLLEDFPQHQFCMEVPVFAEDLGQGRAIQELRKRCQTPDVSMLRETSTQDYSVAVAELHARRAELVSVHSKDGRNGKLNGQHQDSGNSEPSDQELIVEGLKRAAKPAPSLNSWRSPKSTSGALLGMRGGFSPNERQRKGAWSSSASSSTAYRPTTASSSTTRDDQSVAAASDLTTGEDGSALAGNPLEAIRRRRRSCSSGASAAAANLDIRNLMRRYAESTGTKPPLKDQIAAAVGPRLGTPNVRIGPGRRATTPLLAHFEKKQSRPSTASCSSLPGSGPLCEMAPGFSKSRPMSSASGPSLAATPSLRKGGYASSMSALPVTAPTFATGEGEVLVLLE